MHSHRLTELLAMCGPKSDGGNFISQRQWHGTVLFSTQKIFISKHSRDNNHPKTRHLILINIDLSLGGVHGGILETRHIFFPHWVPGNSHMCFQDSGLLYFRKEGKSLRKLTNQRGRISMVNLTLEEKQPCLWQVGRTLEWACSHCENLACFARFWDLGFWEWEH